MSKPRSLSPEALGQVLDLHRTGLGYRSIAERIQQTGIEVNWATVRRAIKGQGAYAHTGTVHRFSGDGKGASIALGPQRKADDST